VVLTLITEAGMIRGTGDTLSAFSTPNVVHFCAALLVSAVLSAPWTGLGPPGVVVALAGLCGVIYAVDVMRRAGRQRDYKPVLEDWVFHAALPILTYSALVFAGIQLVRGSSGALFIVGGATLSLLFIGIHNAWDTVAYVTVERAREHRAERAAKERLAASTTPQEKAVGPS
jgi:hypothetical protein